VSLEKNGQTATTASDGRFLITPVKSTINYHNQNRLKFY
jgi:hypothetical protein